MSSSTIVFDSIGTRQSRLRSVVEQRNCLSGIHHTPMPTQIAQSVDIVLKSSRISTPINYLNSYLQPHPDPNYAPHTCRRIAGASWISLGMSCSQLHAAACPACCTALYRALFMNFFKSFCYFVFCKSVILFSANTLFLMANPTPSPQQSRKKGRNQPPY